MNSTYILSLQTATTATAVALHRNGIVLGSFTYAHGVGQNDWLIDMVDQLLHRLLPEGVLSAIAVSSGPGSYTSLRIGASVAKGLCMGYDVPLIAVNTLQCMVASCRHFPIGGGLWAPLLDARHGRVYALLVDNQGKVVLPGTRFSLVEAPFAPWLGVRDIYFLGAAADHYKQELTAMPGQAHILPAVAPTAEVMGILAYKKFCDGALEDPATFEPMLSGYGM